MTRHSAPDPRHPFVPSPLAARLSPILDIEHPIVQAGMASEYTSADLVAAVSAAGGLGVLGCLDRPADQAVAEIRRIRELTSRPFGVNFVLHRLDPDAFAACLAERVPVVAFFRGDPTATDAVARAHDTGAVVLYQAPTVADAERGLAAGADVLIAQGAEAGGHVGPVPLTSLLPAVVAVAGGTPVLAAGGIVDGPGLAAVLCFGASGAWIGTRFLATPEAPVSPAYKRALLAAKPGDTVAAGLYDRVWETDWSGVRVRTLRNALVARWLDRLDEIPAHRAEIHAGVHAAEAADDPAEYFVLAGEGAGRIEALVPAGDLVREIAMDAERVLRGWAERLADPDEARPGAAR